MTPKEIYQKLKEDTHFSWKIEDTLMEYSSLSGFYLINRLSNYVRYIDPLEAFALIKASLNVRISENK